MSYPFWHVVGVWLSVVVVEDHDGGDHTAGHHEHDAVEVGAWNMVVSRGASFSLGKERRNTGKGFSGRNFKILGEV